jgi:hypothetical protein
MVQTAAGTSGSLNGGRGADLAVFLGIRTHSSGWVLLKASSASVSRWRWRRAQSRDEPQDVGDRDLGHLECDVTTVADDVDGLSSTAS